MLKRYNETTMIAFYARVSTAEQNLDRQLVETSGMVLFEDKCSGAVPFQDRPSGRRILQALQAGELQSLVVHSLDRLGRDLLDILNTIRLFTDHGVAIEIRKEGLRTLDENGKENPTAKMVVSILGVVAEMERSQIRERQLEGIQIAKAQGKYLGRRRGAVETRKTFLAKPRTQRIITYLNKGYAGTEIQKLVGCSPNTIAKVKRLLGDKPPQ
jgi:DNA invertase Pin-like site-specific DNA recombinase